MTTDGAGRIKANIVSLNNIVAASIHHDSETRDAVNDQTPHGAISGNNGQAIDQTITAGRVATIQLNDWCAGESWLCRPVNRDWIRNVWQSYPLGDGLHTGTGNVKNNRVWARRRIGV